MDDPTIVGAGKAPHRSPSVEQASLLWAQLAVTEACVSGACDICLCQDACDLFGQHWEDSHRFSPPAE
jgi:hypothetical protein